MRETRILMTMPITVQVVGAQDRVLLDEAFALFSDIERRFSFFSDDSEVSAFNRSKAPQSPELREIMAIAEKTKRESGGYFDIVRADGRTNPSGITKGWAVLRVADFLRSRRAGDFLVDAGGDVQTAGNNPAGSPWRVGIRSPFDASQVVKVLEPRGCGVATSGDYVRGAHIYDPVSGYRVPQGVASITVVGADVLEADRFATAAFAMGRRGADFIERTPGVECYMIDKDGIATMTSGFDRYVATL